VLSVSSMICSSHWLFLVRLPCSVFCIELPPATASLFPYTTLFRSIAFHNLENLIAKITESGKTPLFLILDQISDARNFGAIIRTDRKSTRLNSSHVKTSYAVFCLKKKTYSS